MRAIWSGQIAFGLVNVPVKLYTATQSHDISFNQVHDADKGRIRYERKCEVCGEAVEFAHIEKAYVEDGKTVVLTDEDLASLPSEEKDEIEVVQFVPGDQIEPMMLSTPYYLEPGGKTPKAYVLLRRTLEVSELTAIVRYTLRSKTRLGVLRTHGELLMLQTLLWPEDVREADFKPIDDHVTVSDKELVMAQALVQQFSGDFQPDDFADDYQNELRQLLDAKLAEGDAVDTAATFGDRTASADGGGTVLSLLDALENSLKKRGGAAATGAVDEDAPKPEAAVMAPPAKKSAAKKSAAKKAAAKKTAVKKKTA